MYIYVYVPPFSSSFFFLIFPLSLSHTYSKSHLDIISKIQLHFPVNCVIKGRHTEVRAASATKGIPLRAVPAASWWHGAHHLTSTGLQLPLQLGSAAGAVLTSPAPCRTVQLFNRTFGLTILSCKQIILINWSSCFETEGLCGVGGESVS